MPNWCSNSIVITGPPEALAAFIDSLQLPNSEGKEAVFSFAQLCRCPAEEQTNPEWNSDNWGTKWDALDPQIDIKSNNEIWLDIMTAWSPPDCWARTAAQRTGVHIEIKYREPGAELQGTILARPEFFSDVAEDFEQSEESDSE